jgi:hypothetical protein
MVRGSFTWRRDHDTITGQQQGTSPAVHGFNARQAVFKHEDLAVHVANHLARLAQSGRYNAESVVKHCTAIATFFREGPLCFDPTARAQFPTVRLVLDGNARTNRPHEPQGARHPRDARRAAR